MNVAKASFATRRRADATAGLACAQTVRRAVGRSDLARDAREKKSTKISTLFRATLFPREASDMDVEALEYVARL